jgi:hypothetical protein
VRKKREDESFWELIEKQEGVVDKPHNCTQTLEIVGAIKYHSLLLVLS